jgi:hypothetical protein
VTTPTAESTVESGTWRRPFAALLQEHRTGALHQELSEALADLVGTCITLDKPGTLTLKLNVIPTKDGLTVVLTDTVTVKAPEAKRGGAVYFADPRGNLSRRNPQQPTLPLRELQTDDEPAALIDLEATS